MTSRKFNCRVEKRISVKTPCSLIGDYVRVYVKDGMAFILSWMDNGCLATGEGTAEKISEFHGRMHYTWNTEIFAVVPSLFAKQLLFT